MFDTNRYNCLMPPRTDPLERLNWIRKLIIIALFSDDEFLDLLVLKGGNAVDLIYGIGQRASIDLDFSLDRDFPSLTLGELRDRFARLLETTFSEVGLKPFDVKFENRPPRLSPKVQDFWGGYSLEFKLNSAELVQNPGTDDRKLRTTAEPAGPGEIKTFSVDFSRHEYCIGKQPVELDGYTIYVYTPAMIVCEKLRAICQQMPAYGPVVDRKRDTSPRAKDFFDIHLLTTGVDVDLTSPANLELLREMFAAKRVPLALLHEISQTRAFHAEGYPSLRDTVKPGLNVRPFDFYFDYVVALVEQLHALGIK